MPLVRHPRGRSALVRAFLFAEIITLAAFLVGPSAGSLDWNEDGVPDVPIVVTASGPIAQIPRPRVVSEVASAMDGDLVKLQAEILAQQAWIASFSGMRINLTLFSLLRC